MNLLSWRAMELRPFALAFGILALWAHPCSLYGQAPGPGQDGRMADHYRQWLARDVAYIITPEEEDVFRNLTTDEERDAFIDQFWERRNPSPGSPANEFKTEHYRRIQYANDHFSSGYDGWKTDRGRIYITFGEPAQIEDHPGGRYDRPYHEGGGTTSAFPFQVWRYRHIPGVGSDVEVEFVDTSETGDYRIARDADEKDALLTMPGQGLTLDELAGRTTKGQRIDNRFVSNPNYFKYMREQDTPFARLYLRSSLERPPPLRNPKMREAVTARVTFDNPFEFRTAVEYLKLSEDDALVLVNLEVPNREIAFSAADLGIRKGTVDIYGRVTSLGGQFAAEFEHTIYTEAPEAAFQKVLQKASIYQKALTLRPGIYKLDLALKNRVSEETSVQSIRLGVPNMTNLEALSMSSLILCRGLVPLGAFPDRAEMFVLGDLKVIPSLDHRFPKNDLVGIYAQVYGFEIDQSLLKPKLSVWYQLVQGETILKNFNDVEGQTVAFASGRRVVLTNSLPTADLLPGEYQLRIKVEDRLSGKKGEIRTGFSVTAPL